MKNLLFIINPSAGRKHIRGKLFEIVDLFVKADYNVNVYTTQAKEDAMRVVSEYGHEYDIIVCAGGDGTLDEVVSGCMKGKINSSVGYIPCGTTNDFAQSLGIPKDPIRAAKRIIKYDVKPVDIGRFNDTNFVYVAAFGAFTEVTYTTPQEYKNYFGHAAYVFEGIKSIASLNSYHMKITYDEKTIEDDFIYGMISNSVTVGGFTNPNSKIAELEDGKHEVLLVKYPSNPFVLQATATEYFMGEFNPEYMYQFKTSKLTVESYDPVTWTLDGEFGGNVTFAEIENLNGRLNLIRK